MGVKYIVLILDIPQGIDTMRKLISNSKIMCGIFRAIVLEAWNTEASLYIPALHRTQMPFAIDESGTITGLANGESLDVLDHTSSVSTPISTDNSSSPDGSEEDTDDDQEGKNTENPDEDEEDDENNTETRDTEPEEDEETGDEGDDTEEETDKAESDSSATVNPSEPIILTDNAGNKLAMQLKDFPKAQLSCWIGRSTVKPGMPLWIAFENEDSEFPIILGTLGSTLEYGELGSLLGGGGSASALSGVGFNGEYYEGLPTYTLSEEAITDIATMITGETGGEDVLACKQEASQLANLNEVRQNRSNTEEDILATLHCGWYATSSWSRGCTETAKSAVRTCLVDGKRVLPRYVTEHDMFPGDISNAKDRSEYQKGDDVSNIYGADYKFYCFFGTSEDGDISGYYPEDYEKYKDDDAKKVSIANASGVVAAAIQWATETANSATIGYSQANRWGPNSYDCSSFVISAYDAAGLNLKSSGANSTHDMVDVMLKLGFQDVTSTITLSTGEGLQPGDVLWASGHTEMMVDSTHRAGAHTSNRALADQVSVEDYYNHPWSKVLRYTQK